MKLIYILTILLIVVFSCKKEITPEDLERQKLQIMRTNIINDWKIIKIMTVRPLSEYGTIATSFCEDAAIFSFKSDSAFNYIGNPACYSRQNIKGVWKLPKADSLFITFTENWIIGAYENLEVTKLTADTMQWNILASSANGVITQQYSLIPK